MAKRNPNGRGPSEAQVLAGRQIDAVGCLDDAYARICAAIDAEFAAVRAVLAPHGTIGSATLASVA